MLHGIQKIFQYKGFTEAAKAGMNYCKLLDLPEKCRDDICNHIKIEKSKIPEREEIVAAEEDEYFRTDKENKLNYTKFHVELASLDFCTLSTSTQTENHTQVKKILGDSYFHYFSETIQPQSPTKPQRRKKYKRKH